MSKPHYYDILIIGSGAAGLTAALQAADYAKIAVICKGSLNEGSTYYAQGGIAAVLDENDSEADHINDTLIAGAGLCNERAVQFTINQSETAVNWLIEQGVQFSRADSEDYHLTREGGHSHRRVIHAADATGKALSTTLTQRALENPNIDMLPHRAAINLVLEDGRVQGAYVLDIENDSVELLQAKFVILATGGASKTYLYTSNPDGASGDGIAMAWRAGCRVANLEFNQFHPTCLFHPKAKSFLITEAIRGEGGKLLLPSGERFMENFDQRAELAPRDIVARAIDHEMKRLGADCLYLDITHKSAEFLLEHFPTIRARCLELGIDISKEPIPIVPAAHYTCGGIVTDLNGKTDINNLYAIGETANTGLHGANRMASNSLLECIVFGRAAANSILSYLEDTKKPTAHALWDESQVTNSDEDVVISHNWDEVRRFMWDYVGIVRSNKRLERALHRATLLQTEINEYYSNYKVSSDLIELRNLALVSELIVRSALQRKESRGLHFTLDYPNKLDHPEDTILTPANFNSSNIKHCEPA